MRRTNRLLQMLVAAAVSFGLANVASAAVGADIFTGASATSGINNPVTPYTFTANSGTQVIKVYTGLSSSSGSTATFSAFDFNVQIGTGATSSTNPSITAINIVPTNGLFATNNTGTSPGETNSGNNQAWSDSTTTSSGTVSLSSSTATNPVLLATVTIQTNGVTPGTYNLSFNNFTNAPLGLTLNSDLGVNFVNNGNTTIVINSTPEPSSAVLFGLAIPCLLARRRRHQV